MRSAFGCVEVHAGIGARPKVWPRGQATLKTTAIPGENTAVALLWSTATSTALNVLPGKSRVNPSLDGFPGRGPLATRLRSFVFQYDCPLRAGYCHHRSSGVSSRPCAAAQSLLANDPLSICCGRPKTTNTGIVYSVRHVTKGVSASEGISNAA